MFRQSRIIQLQNGAFRSKSWRSCCKVVGALGAYQAGVYEALSEAGIHPNWISGVSIGAINAAIVAGNPPDTRIDRQISLAARIG